MKSEPVLIRPATSSDLVDIVRMLADDTLGIQREQFTNPLPDTYHQTFQAIEQDRNNELVVAEDDTGQVVAVLQLTCTPYITHQGGWRATIEGVRVDSRFRGTGLGRKLFDWAIKEAEKRGCHLIQLTTDKQRPDAKQFYESLGFVASHEGMKMKLSLMSNKDPF